MRLVGIGSERLVRAAVWLFTHTLYRLTVVGRPLPERGGALLVCNTVSYIDHAILLAALHRPVRFFMGKEFYRHPLLWPLARAVGAIPIARDGSPKEIVRSLEEARAAIARGEVVCIFAEGDVTRTGNMLPFGRGLEFIMRGSDAPVIPMHLDRIWGSTFTMVQGRLKWRLPKVIPYPVTLSIGAPLPSAVSAFAVRRAVQELSAAAFNLRGDNQRTLHAAFLRDAAKHPFLLCMADSLGTRLTYAQTVTAALALARTAFPGPPRVREETVGILLPTSCAGALTNIAVLCAGRVPVNLNYTASREVLDASLRSCGARTVISSRAFLEKIGLPAVPGTVMLEDLRARIGALRRILLFCAVLVLPGALLERLFVRGTPRDLESLATIIFSSGSTGVPKGVMLTHRNVMSNIEGIYPILNVRRSDMVMSVLPFFHSFGFTATLWFPLTAGLRVVFHPNPMDATTIGSLVQRHRATIIMGTPTFLAAYQRKCRPDQFATLRYVIAGAEKLSRSIAESFFATFGVPVFEGYGCTELSPIVSLGIPSYIHPEGKFVQVGNKPGTVGHPIPGVAAAVARPDTLDFLPPNEPGILHIKGPNVMRGYLNDPELTAQVIREGWYVTADIATIDDDGFIAITDRASRFSKIAGEMVPHIRIEEAVRAVLGTAEPVCAVSAVPDERRGERLVVMIACDADMPALWEALRDQGLPNLWLPKREDFFRVEHIPLLGSGKVDLAAMRRMAMDCVRSAGRMQVDPRRSSETA